MRKACRKVPLKISMHTRVLHEDFDKKICEIKKMSVDFNQDNFLLCQ